MKTIFSMMLVLLFAYQVVFAGGKNLEVKACPELQLEDYMLQGELISQKDFAGKVVWIEFFQNSCPGCIKNSLPHFQLMWEKYKDNPDCILLAVNTAFEKKQYPVMADEGKTKKLLKSKGWTFPVARDKDEKTIEMFKVEYQGRLTYGTPMGVVIDAEGKVVAQGFSSAKPEQFEKAFEAALEAVAVPAPRAVVDDLKPVVALIKEGKLADAYANAVKAAAEEGPESVMADAVYLKELLEQAAAKRIAFVEKQYCYDPLTAVEAAEKRLARFAGIGSVNDFLEKTKQWKDSGEFSRFKGDHEKLESIRNEMTGAWLTMTKEEGQEWTGALVELVESNRNNVVGERAQREIDAIAASFKGPGYLGITSDAAYTGEGVKISQVYTDSPAEKAGLQVGDIIAKINDSDTSTLQSLIKIMGDYHPGDILEIHINRESSNQRIKATLGHPAR